MRSFVNEGIQFRSIDYQRTKLQSLLQEVQSQMQASKGHLLDLVKCTLPSDHDANNQKLSALVKIKNLEQFSKTAVKLVKANFESVLTKGVNLERQMSTIEERS